MSEREFARKVNKSKSYILPLLEGSINIQYTRLIINTYLYIKPDPELEYRCIHILYDKALTQQELFDDYIEEVKRCSLYVDFKEINEGYLLTFQIPEEHYKDYDYFIVGKYSKLEDSSKKKILYHLYKHYPELNELIKKIEHILYKDEKLKKAWENKLDTTIPKGVELSSVMEPKDETYEMSINN